MWGGLIYHSMCVKDKELIVSFTYVVSADQLQPHSKFLNLLNSFVTQALSLFVSFLIGTQCSLQFAVILLPVDSCAGLQVRSTTLIFLILILVFWEMVFLTVLELTHCVVQAGLKLGDLPASPLKQVLRLGLYHYCLIYFDFWGRVLLCSQVSWFYFLCFMRLVFGCLCFPSAGVKGMQHTTQTLSSGFAS